GRRPDRHRDRGGAAGSAVRRRRDRCRRVRLPHGLASGFLGGVLPGQQHHRRKAPLGEDHEGRSVAERGAQPVWVCAAAHSRDTYLSAQFWRLARRIGKKKAAMAVGHSILVIAWNLMSSDKDFTDLGGDYFTRSVDNTERRRDHLVRELQGMGYRVTV